MTKVTHVNIVKSKNAHDFMSVEVTFPDVGLVRFRLSRSGRSIRADRRVSNYEARLLLNAFGVYMQLEGTGFSNGERMAMIEEFCRTAKGVEDLKAFLAQGPKGDAKVQPKPEPEVVAARARKAPTAAIAVPPRKAAKKAAPKAATKYTYPAGMSADDKRKFRAAARKAAKK